MAIYNTMIVNKSGTFGLTLKDKIKTPSNDGDRLNTILFHLSIPFGGGRSINTSALGDSKIFTGGIISGKVIGEKPNKYQGMEIENKTSTQDVLIPAILSKMEYGTSYEMVVEKSDGIKEQMFEALKIDIAITLDKDVGMKIIPALFVASDKNKSNAAVYCLMLEDNTASFALEISNTVFAKNNWNNLNFIEAVSLELADQAINMINMLNKANKS